MSKLSIDFILLDESVVMYGFRDLMSGGDIEQFKKNPVMLLMHGRAEARFEPLENDVVLPIGKWYDVRIEGSQLLAKPDFDDDDDFAMKIQNKVEKGYLNAASVALEPIAVSDEQDLKLQGQTGPTITKWGVLESSIVDIPNCRNALAIRNSAGKVISLNGSAENTEVTSYLKSLLPEKTELRVYNLIDSAIATGKLSATDRSKYIKLAISDYYSVKHLIDRLNPLEIELLSSNVEIQELIKLSGRELYMNGKIERLKVLSPYHFKLKYKEYFDKDYPYDDLKTNESVLNHLSSQNKDNSELTELLRLSGRDLYLQGKFERLKALSFENFKVKYQEYYGAAYN